MSEKDTTASSTPTPAPSPMELVLQFHHTYSVPIRSFSDPTLDYERMNMRMSLIAEEFAELMGAVYGPRARAIIEAATAEAVAADEGERDVIEAADALADLVYVVYGMAIESGMNLDSVLAEVQASNLSKLMPDGSVKLREDGKVLKGPNFFQPNIARGLGLESPTDSGEAD
ncbi:pyrophosphohydrolase domain-containing protein [Actinomyces sp.]